MRLKFLFVFLIILTLFGFISAKSVLADSFSISGNVKDNTGTAVVGATVDIYNTGTTTDVVPPTSTDQSGNYSFASVPQGTYDIKVTPPAGSGFSPIAAPSKIVSSNVTLNFTFAPVGSVSLSGYLHDSQGHVVNNQKISLVNSNNTSFAATTDSTGFFSIQVQAGTYNLFIQSPSFPHGSNLSLNVPEDYGLIVNSFNLSQSENVDLTLPAYQVNVHAQDTSSNAISGVEMDTNQPQISNLSIGAGLIAHGSSGYGVSADHGPTTDQSGNTTLWLFPGGYSVTATPPSGSNYDITTSGVTVTSSTTQLTMTLGSSVTLSGFIHDSQGNIVSNQKVSLVDSNNTSFPTTTDSNGHFSLNVQAGTYHLYIQSPNSGNALTLDAPEDYTLLVNTFNLTQSQSLNIVLPAYQVNVHVQDTTGAAVSGVEIDTDQPQINNLSIGSNLVSQGNSGYGIGIHHGPTTDQSGNASVWLFPGSYSFTAKPPSGTNYDISTSGVTVTNNTQQQTIILNSSVTLSGYIHDAQGNTVSNQTVSLVDSNNMSFPTTTDSTGHFSLNIQTGTYHVYVQSPNSGNALSLAVPEDYSLLVNTFNLTQTESLNIVLPVNEVNVRVENATGTAVSEIELDTDQPQINNLSIGSNLVAQGNSGYGIGIHHGPTTDQSGNATLWLFPGSYTFTAKPPSGSIYSLFTDGVSITGNQSEVISLQYSHTTPVTTADLETLNADNTTYSNPTTVTLTATAAAGYNFSSPGGTFYKLDNDSTVTYSTPFTVTGNGNHTIEYWSTDNSGVQETHHTQTFTIASYTLSGIVYNDANQNGVQDPGEQGYQGATITLTSGHFSTTATTDTNGNYSFIGLQPGTYTEQLIPPNGYAPTTSNPVTINLNADTTQNFGIAQSNALVTAINAGGDTQGNFVADTDYSEGTAYSSSASVDTSSVSNPAPVAVYQTVRYGNSFSYTIPNLTANGTYTVRLHFNELYWGTALSGNSGGDGSRVFNVKINQNTVLSNFDTYQAAGGANKAIVEQFPATAESNGTITINFDKIIDNAMVSGIEIYNGTLPSPSITPTPTPASSAIINAGGNAVGNFAADNSYSGGTPYSTTASVDTNDVTNPAPEEVYQSVRYGDFYYYVTNLTPSTNYLVRLHFNELYWTSAGQRTFNVKINENQVLTNFDIFQAAGGVDKAVVQDFVVPSDNYGRIKIQFISDTDQAAVSGIEIIPPTIPARTYYTANEGTNFTRSTMPFVTGVATQTVNNDGSITLNADNPSGYVDSGFVLYEGTLGNLPNFTTVGNGNQYSLNLWFDTNNDNEYFAWDPNGILTSLNGDTYALGNGSQNGNEYINGQSQFFLLSDGQDHTLSDFKNGNVSGINANTKVAVWFGVNTSNGSTSSTLQAIEGL